MPHKIYAQSAEAASGMQKSFSRSNANFANSPSIKIAMPLSSKTKIRLASSATPARKKTAKTKINNPQNIIALTVDLPMAFSKM